MSSRPAIVPTGSPPGCPARSSRMPSVLSSTPLIRGLRFSSCPCLVARTGQNWNDILKLNYRSELWHHLAGRPNRRGGTNGRVPQASSPTSPKAPASTWPSSAPAPAAWPRRSSPPSNGQRVLLVERTEYLGGTSALSAATTWVPGTRLAATVGADDSREKVSGFLDRAVGNRAPKALREAFLDAGPEAIHTLLDRTEVQFRARPFHPDYLYELEGSTSCGRALEPEPFDGRALGADLALIRPPIPEFTILGGMAIDRDDIRHLLKMTTSLESFALFRAAHRPLRPRPPAPPARPAPAHGQRADRPPPRRRAAARRHHPDRGAASPTSSPTDGAVTGLVVEQAGTTRRLATTRGVVLASGGFTRHPQRRQQMLPAPAPEWSPAAPGHTGELHDIVARPRRPLRHRPGAERLLGADLGPPAQGRLDGRLPALRPRPLEARHLHRRPRRPALRQRVALLPRVRRRHVRRQPRRLDHPGLPRSPTASR